MLKMKPTLCDFRKPRLICSKIYPKSAQFAGAKPGLHSLMKQRLAMVLNLSLVSAIVILGFNVISPVLPQYALSFSVPVAVTGWAVSAFAIARIFMDMPAGVLADRFGRKRNMVIGLVLVIISSLAAGSAPTFLWLVAGRAVQGLGSALYMTAATAWLARVSGREHRGKFMSIHSGALFISNCFGPVIGGLAAAHFGLRAPFYIYGVTSVLGLLATIPLKDTPTKARELEHRTITFNDVRFIFSSAPFLIVSAAIFASFFMRGGVRSTLIPLYASLNLGMSEEQIGLLLTVAAIVSAVVTFPAGWMSDRIGRKAPSILCLFLSAIAVIMIGQQQTIVGLMMVMAFLGLANGLQGSAAAWPADVVPEEKLGAAMGAYRFIGDVGMMLGPISVTYFSTNAGLTMVPFVIQAGIIAAMGILLFWAPDPVRSRAREASRRGTLTLSGG